VSEVGLFNFKAKLDVAVTADFLSSFLGLGKHLVPCK